MPREWLLRIEDILDAIRRIEQYLEGHDPATFGEDSRTLEAVAFNILVLGEAASRVPEDVRKRYPEIPWSRMSAIRNVIAHEYFEIQPAILWKTARENLPPLVAHLERLLADER